MDTKLAAVVGGPTPLSAAPATYCVLGPAGAGLSVATRLLMLLGVPFGDRPEATDDTYELDTEANSALDVSTPEARRQSALAVGALAAEVDRQVPVWGWCDPLAPQLADAVLPLLRGPRIVAMFRDPYLVARRRALEFGSDTLDAHDEVLGVYERMHRLVAAGTYPYVMIGMDKAVARPDECVQALADFVGVEPDPAARAAAVALLRGLAPSPAIEGIDAAAVERALATLNA